MCNTNQSELICASSLKTIIFGKIIPERNLINMYRDNRLNRLETPKSLKVNTKIIQ